MGAVRFTVSVFFLGGFCGQLEAAWWDYYWPIGEEREECDCCNEEYRRIQGVAPFYEASYQQDGGWGALRPFAVHLEDCKYKTKDDYFLYPLFSRHQGPGGNHWTFFTLIRGGSSGRAVSGGYNEFTLFPFYARRNTGDPETSYTGVFPVAGKVRNYFGNHSIKWLFFPLYLGIEETKGTVRHGLPWPFIRWQTGCCSGGGALWPLWGHFWKKGKYDHKYGFWPLIYKFEDDLDKPIPRLRKGFLPFYTYECSEEKEVKQILWPFVSHIQYHTRCYEESQYLWPFLVQGRGDQYVNRWAPIYTHSIREGVDKRWYFWPLLKVMNWEDCDKEITQSQFLYFLIWIQKQWDLCHPEKEVAKKMHVWPLYSYWNDGCGKKQFQALSPLEVLFPANKAVRHGYSPLFSIIKLEQVAPGHSRQSILFNLVSAEKKGTEYQRFGLGPLLRYEKKGNCKEVDFLYGLLGYKKRNNKKSFKFLWMTF